MSKEPIGRPFAKLDDANPVVNAAAMTEQVAHVDRLEESLGASLFTKGVLAGLSLARQGAQLFVREGVAVDANGRLVVLAENGFARFGGNAVTNTANGFPLAPLALAANRAYDVILRAYDETGVDLGVAVNVLVQGNQLRPEVLIMPAPYADGADDVVIGRITTDGAGALATVDVGGRKHATVRAGALALVEPGGAAAPVLAPAGGGVVVTSGGNPLIAIDGAGTVSAEGALRAKGDVTAGGSVTAQLDVTARDVTAVRNVRAAGDVSAAGNVVMGGDLLNAASQAVRHADLRELVGRGETKLHRHPARLPRVDVRWLYVGYEQFQSSVTIVLPERSRVVAWAFLAGEFQAQWVSTDPFIQWVQTPTMRARLEITHIDGASNAREGGNYYWILELLGMGPVLRAPFYAGTVQSRLDVLLTRYEKRQSRLHAGVVVMSEPLSDLDG